jgi:glycosyltransferase involved in cell wall biosynthesis
MRGTTAGWNARLRVLVYPHAMEIGGSQLNAIEIAAAVRDRGHRVAVVSRPGALVETVRRLGLSHFPLDPRARRLPSPRAAIHLTSLVRRHRIDVVHGYEWPPTVEAFAGPRLMLGQPVVSTVMSMAVAPFLPRTVPLIVGTDEIRRRAVEAGYASVTLIEPPVDVDANTPEFDPGPFRASLGLDAAAPLLVIVGRLAAELKLEGLLSACDTVGKLAASGVAVQLAVVGDGPVRPQIERAAIAANTRAGSRIVALTGQLKDPRPAYAAADVILGMGGSALRGLAFGKPLIVQGERGFWELLTPESAHFFLRHGWYGLGAAGEGRVAGVARLEAILRGLLDQPAHRARLGSYGRTLVAERFSLNRTGAVQEEVYAVAMEARCRQPVLPLARDAGRVGIGLLRYKVTRKWRRWRGAVASDDFNAMCNPPSTCRN